MSVRPPSPLPFGPSVGSTIDVQLLRINRTRTALGVGDPVDGSEYLELATELSSIADRLAEAVLAAGWMSPAGQLFSGVIEVLVGVVRVIGEVVAVVAGVLDRQAGAVVMARTRLADIRVYLMAGKAEVVAVVGADPVAARLLEQAVVTHAQDVYDAAMGALLAASEQSAGVVNTCNERLVACWADSHCGDVNDSVVEFSAGTAVVSAVGGAMSVTPESLTDMATVLLNQTLYLGMGLMGRTLLVEVRKTHGDAGAAVAFDSSLARFTESFARVTSEVQAQVTVHGENLMGIGMRYYNCDVDTAGIVARDAL